MNILIIIFNALFTLTIMQIVKHCIYSCKKEIGSIDQILFIFLQNQKALRFFPGQIENQVPPEMPSSIWWNDMLHEKVSFKN